MRLSYLLGLCLILSCKSEDRKVQLTEKNIELPVVDTLSYDQLKKNVREKRKLFSKENFNLKDEKNLDILRNYWVSTLLNDFYLKWANTPWDYNGTTEQPRLGNIACGYFVTTLLRDMDVKIQRVKLAVCPSSQMMKMLTPKQRLINLSALSYADFNDRITRYGKGVFVIGFHFV